MKKSFTVILVLMISIVIIGCTGIVNSLGQDIDFQADAHTKKADAALIQASNRFGMNVFQNEIDRTQNSNIIISPVSLFTVFNVLSNGASGKTKKEIKTVTHTGHFPDDKLNQEMNTLINNYHSQKYNDSDTGDISIYNSIWLDRNFKVKDPFVQTAKTYYDSDLFHADFSRQNTVKQMNRWIAQKSNDLIKDPVQAIDKTTPMALFNVLHFKGKWVQTFNKAKTKPEPFTLKTGKETTIKMMNDERMIDYYEDDQVQAGAFNYYNGSMLILLPKGDINAYIAKLNPQTIEQYLQKAESKRAKVKIPVFDVSYKEDMVKTLKHLGIKQTFDAGQADFSGIKDTKTPLWIGQVLHQCVVNVDEEGTEGAALTAVMLCGAGQPPKETKQFYVNKPFVFVIQDETNQSILFIGKVENPAS